MAGMWKIIKRVAIGAGVMSAPLIVLSTTSIPASVKAADGFIYENLKWLCERALGCVPSANLATSATDNLALLIGLLFLAFAILVGSLWAKEKWFSNSISVKFCRLVFAGEVPTPDQTAIRLVVKNTANEKLTGLVAQLVSSDPAMLAYPVAFHLPLTLATKSRLDAYRNTGHPLPHMPFDLNAGDEKHVEVFWLRTNASLEGYITHEAGQAEFLTYPGYVFEVQISGEGKPAKCRVKLIITDEETSAWDCELLED